MQTWAGAERGSKQWNAAHDILVKLAKANSDAQVRAVDVCDLDTLFLSSSLVVKRAGCSPFAGVSQTVFWTGVN